MGDTVVAVADGTDVSTLGAGTAVLVVVGEIDALVARLANSTSAVRKLHCVNLLFLASTAEAVSSLWAEAPSRLHHHLHHSTFQVQEVRSVAGARPWSAAQLPLRMLPCWPHGLALASREFLPALL